MSSVSVAYGNSRMVVLEMTDSAALHKSRYQWDDRVWEAEAIIEPDDNGTYSVTWGVTARDGAGEAQTGQVEGLDWREASTLALDHCMYARSVGSGSRA